MSRIPISKKRSIQVITILLILVALATIWPMRLYHEVMSYTGGSVTQISDLVTDAEDVGEYFTAQYDHLQSVEVYIESVDYGAKFTARLFDQTDGVNTQLAVEKVSFPENDLPGYVTIPMDVDLVPGNIYVLVLSGAVRKEDPSAFRVGFESAEDAAANPDAPIYNVAFHHDTGISGVALSMRTHYEEPLTKAKSALAAGIVLLIGVAALLVQRWYYRRFPKAEHYVPLLTVCQYALTPVIAIPALLAAVAVFPLRLYDSRVMDVLIYEAGVLIAAGFLLYGLWHSRVGIRERFESPEDILTHLPEILMIVDIALILRSACTYMNAVNDYVHRDSEAQIVIGLVVLILLLGKARWAINAWTIVTAIAALVLGRNYVRTQEMLIASEGGREMAERMANAVSAATAAGFLAVGAVSVLVMLTDVLRDRRGVIAAMGGKCDICNELTDSVNVKKPAAGSVLTSRILPAALLLFLILACICRNGRTWIVVMTITWGMLYLRYAFSRMRERGTMWLVITAYGILLHFACTVVWTMMHRYYIAYNYSRFSMHFHTVTVTAYYLLIVSAAALSLFLLRLRQVQGLPLRRRIARMWKEIAALGTVCSYMVMSMTRAGVYSLAVLVFVGIACTFAGEARPLRRMSRALGTIILVTLLTFPSIFTGQRIISTTIADPVLYAPVEEYFDVLMRHTPWNSTEFMNLEIFLRDSMDRLIGGGIGSRIYYILQWNIPQGYDTARGEDSTSDNRAVTMAAGDDRMDPSWNLSAGEAHEDVSWNLSAGEAHEDASWNLSAGSDLADAAEADDILSQTMWFSADGSQPVSGLLTNIRYGVTGETLVAAVSDEVIAGITTGSYGGGDFSNGRTDIWRAYLAQMNLTGHEGMALTMANGETAIHAHNILIQMAYDCGAPVGVLFAVVIVLTLAGAAIYYRRHRGDEAALLPLLAMVGFVTTGMVEWIFHLDNPYTIVFMMILAPIMFGERHVQ